MFSRFKQNAGQASVEAALLFPVILMIIALLVEPICILYTKTAMDGACAEGLRVAKSKVISPFAAYAGIAGASMTRAILADNAAETFAFIVFLLIFSPMSLSSKHHWHLLCSRQESSHRHT
mgnify:CR=1 FL=1